MMCHFQTQHAHTNTHSHTHTLFLFWEATAEATWGVVPEKQMLIASNRCGRVERIKVERIKAGKAFIGKFGDA